MSEAPLLDPGAARRATEALPNIPRDASGPVFREPWEAHAFAMALALHDRGVFSWPEWAAMLAEETGATLQLVHVLEPVGEAMINRDLARVMRDHQTAAAHEVAEWVSSRTKAQVKSFYRSLRP